MKITKIIFLCTSALGLMSCNNDSSVDLLEIESQQVSNLYAPQIGGNAPGQAPISGQFTKFDFETGSTTLSETEWDVAFRGTTIIVNGGTSLGTTDEPERIGNVAVYIAVGTFGEITEVNPSAFVQDSSTGYAIPLGGGNGWYDYNFMLNLITPTPGRVLVFRTTEGKYAKVEILSYYENAPANPDSTVDEARYYTFNYVYQPNSGLTTFE